ncbi:Cell wall / vacuolar inhibitor of fructosidase 1 [Glycine soja]|uniref:Cell wall / vacuolar inhibitor of fructosidase 1 n=1 Tax=Glycine soja TaxID=3848 RepID=A0A445F065_GLYSO|nr:Cell wall / vacuolar inhibitor of fructosidase 1 [Glycine soja]
MSACHCRVLQPNDLKLIEETCKRTPNPNLCLQLLKADPRAPSADIAGLALILVDVIKAKATEAEKTIKQLLKQGGNKKALSECADDYDGILMLDVPTATRAVRGDPKFAENTVSDCAVEADSCENGFHGKSPLTHVNNVPKQKLDRSSTTTKNTFSIVKLTSVLHKTDVKNPTPSYFPRALFFACSSSSSSSLLLLRDREYNFFRFFVQLLRDRDT